MLSRRMGALLSAIALATAAVGAAVPASAATSPGPDFTVDRNANFAAAMVSNDLATALGADAGVVGQRVTAAGLEVMVSSQPNAAELAAVASVTKSQAATLSANGIDPTAYRVPITFRVVPNSLATLTKLTDQLTSDQATWTAKGILFSSWGPDVDNDVVGLRLQNYTPAAAAALEAAYGPLLKVSAVSEKAAASSRDVDSAPWFGGDIIVGPSPGCTSWFSTISGAGAAVSLTAGHCGSGTWTQAGHTFGTTSALHFGGPMDGQTIPVTSNAQYISSDPTSVDRTVTGVASTDTVGVLTCTDGQKDREVCNVRIDNPGQTVSYNGQTITGLVAAHQTGNLAAFTPGDSGGPVETTSGPNLASAQGMIEAQAGAPYSSGWYMPARTVDSYFNVYVKTN